MSLCLAPRASETEEMMLSMATMVIMVATIGLLSHRQKNCRCNNPEYYVFMSCIKSKRNERYEVEHGDDADSGKNHRPVVAPPEEPSLRQQPGIFCCLDVLHQALNFPISFSIFQFFIFLQKSTNRSMGGGGAAHPAIWKQTASL